MKLRNHIVNAEVDSTKLTALLPLPHQGDHCIVAGLMAILYMYSIQSAIKWIFIRFVMPLVSC